MATDAIWTRSRSRVKAREQFLCLLGWVAYKVKVRVGMSGCHRDRTGWVWDPRFGGKDRVWTFCPCFCSFTSWGDWGEWRRGGGGVIEGEQTPEKTTKHQHDLEEGDELESSALRFVTSWFLAWPRMDTYLLQALRNKWKLPFIKLTFQNWESKLWREGRLKSHRLASVNNHILHWLRLLPYNSQIIMSLEKKVKLSW